jgi:hypothetical protein
MFWGNMSMLKLPIHRMYALNCIGKKTQDVGLFSNAGFDRDTFLLIKTPEILYARLHLRK